MNTNVETDQTIEKLARCYGVKVQAVTVYPSYYLRAAAYRVKTDRGDIMVKSFRGSERRRQTVDRLTLSLQRKGYPYMPKWVVSKEGKRWIRYNNTWFYATEWIEGQQLCTSLDGLGHLGHALAKLHLMSPLSDRSRPKATQLQVKLQYEENKFQSRLARVQSEDSVIGEWFRAHGPTCLALSCAAWQVLWSPEAAACLHQESMHPIVVHGDVTRPNTIERANGVCLIDWEQVHHGSALYELSRALANTTDFVVENIGAMLDGYQSLRPLTAAERQIVSGLFTFPREAWYTVSERRNSKKANQHMGVLARLWDNRLTAANWMQKWATCNPN